MRSAYKDLRIQTTASTLAFVLLYCAYNPGKLPVRGISLQGGSSLVLICRHWAGLCFASGGLVTEKSPNLRVAWGDRTIYVQTYSEAVPDKLM